MKKALPGIFIISAVTSLVFIFTSLTLAIFTENETSQNNVLSTALESKHLVINEVYYDPDSLHMEGISPVENDFEWVEIYNPTNYTFNLKNWKIGDNSASERTISTTDRTLGPGEFVVIGKAENISTIWGIPEDKFIALGLKIGNGLANTDDRVILKDDADNIVDQMSYGEEDTTAFDPSAPDVADGHSLERDPDGVDTDSAADFVDRNPPTPIL